MLDILRTTSPTHLRILGAEFPPSRPVPLMPVFLPGLTELHISGLFSKTFFTQSHTAPALRRLYVGRHLGHGVQDFGASLKRICPLLTHLRVRAPYNTDLRRDTFLQFVHTYCRFTRPLDKMCLSSWGSVQNIQLPPYDPIVVDEASIPPLLHRVIVDFTSTGIHRTTSPYMGVAHLARHAKGIQMEEDRSDLKKRSLFIVPHPPPSEDEDLRLQRSVDDFSRAKSQWLERSVGVGAGCWD